MVGQLVGATQVTARGMEVAGEVIAVWRTLVGTSNRSPALFLIICVVDRLSTPGIPCDGHHNRS